VPALINIPLHIVFLVVNIILVFNGPDGPAVIIIGSIITVSIGVLLWLVVFSAWQEIREEKRGGGNRAFV